LLPDMMDRKDIVARFLREGKAAVKLKGEHVARVHDVGRLESQVPFIVMEYLEGADLNAILKHHGAQDSAIAVDLILQACEALAEAHSIGIIHRDIKASNFFITQPENQAPILKVLDFGIATAPEGTSDLTSTQSVIGTPAYMAPEQMRSSRTVDARSDIWSIGVVLYELLEGARPFRSEVYSELVLKVGMDPPVPMENPTIPEALRAIVLRCLEKQVDKRYQTVAELAFDLMPFASDPVAARASVEQCARLLGRRGSRVFDVPAIADRTPAPKTPTGSVPISLDPGGIPKRITPAKSLPVPQSSQPISSSQPSLPDAPDVLGRPSSVSIRRLSSSVGAPKRRGVALALAILSVVIVAGAGAFLAMRDNGRDATDAPPVAPAIAPPEAKPAAEPPKPEPEMRRIDLDPPPAAATVETPTIIEPPPKQEPPVKVATPMRPKATVKAPPRRPPPPQKKKDPPPPPGPGGKLFEKRQ
jgi:serine/threonine-protein kinase